VADRWFSPSTPVSSTNKTDRLYSKNIVESGDKHHNPNPMVGGVKHHKPTNLLIIIIEHYYRN
jgi:hypothetical protein